MNAKAAFANSISKIGKTKYRDEDFYMSHFQKDAMTEKGYARRLTVNLLYTDRP